MPKGMKLMETATFVKERPDLHFGAIRDESGKWVHVWLYAKNGHYWTATGLPNRLEVDSNPTVHEKNLEAMHSEMLAEYLKRASN